MPALRHELHYGSRVFPCLVERPASVDDMFRAAVERGPESLVLVDGDVRLSYATLDVMVDRVAAALAGMGVVAGERVATLLDNGIPCVVLMLACARLGAVLVSMNIRQRAPETEYMLNNSGAVVLVYESALVAYLPDAGAVPMVRHRVAVGGDGDGYAKLLTPAEALPRGVRDEEAAFCILYTSGTTGRPKGAVLTHLSVVHSCLNYEWGLGLRQGDRAVLAVPASHVTGLVAIILSMIRVSGCIVMMGAFKAGRYLEIVAAERISFSLMVPAMYNLCVRDALFETVDLSSWRVGGFGGAPMPEATIATLARLLPGLTLSNVYGSTETTSPVTMLPGAEIAARPDSVGRVLPGCDIRIMDDEGREVPAGTGGELWIAGPMVVPGYWENAETTAAGFVHGYWRSGDIGSVDAEGYVRVFDRKKDMINRGGFKIYSIEVENVLSHHPEIVEAAVISRPCPVLGERVEAFVVARRAGLSEDDVRRFCAERLSDYKIPDFVNILEAPLPRNANGKLQKAVLRQGTT